MIRHGSDSVDRSDSDSLQRLGPLSPTDGRTDGLTKNLHQTQPSLTVSDAHARIRKLGLPIDDTERHPQTRTDVRTPIPDVIRRAVLARDWYRCTWCGTGDQILHVDHILPWSAGGTNETTNLRTLCQPCNLDRSNYLTDTNAVRVLPIVYGCFSCATRTDPFTQADEPAERIEYGPRAPVWCFKCWRPGVAEVAFIAQTLERQRRMPPDAPPDADPDLEGTR